MPNFSGDTGLQAINAASAQEAANPALSAVDQMYEDDNREKQRDGEVPAAHVRRRPQAADDERDVRESSGHHDSGRAVV